MHYLLDTHVWLWLDGEPERIPKAHLELFAKPSTHLYLSSISCWEIMIKTSQEKLRLKTTPERLFNDLTTNYQAMPLDFSRNHAVFCGCLPKIHKDPFDRALMAQAQVEHLKFVTADNQLAAYDSTVVLIS